MFLYSVYVLFCVFFFSILFSLNPHKPIAFRSKLFLFVWITDSWE